MRTRFLVCVAAVAVLMISAVAPAWAASDTMVFAFTAAEEEAPTEEGAEDEEFVSEGGVVPAVEAPPADEPDNDQPWTFRFMVPAVLALGVLGLIGAGVYYAFRIRGRYQVVE